MQSFVLLAWFVWAVACAWSARALFQRVLEPRTGRYAYLIACLGWLALLLIGFLVVRSADSLMGRQLSHSAYAVAYWTAYFSPFGLPTLVGAPVVLLSDLVRFLWKRVRGQPADRREANVVRSDRTSPRRTALVAGGGALVILLGLGLAITPPPSHELADEIDRLVEQDPCIADVDEWDSRSYSWAASPPDGRSVQYPLWPLSAPWIGSDRSFVDLHFHQGAYASFYPAGRNRLRADQVMFVIDDSNTNVASGTYDVEARRLIDWSCGPNIGEAASVTPEPPSQAP